MANNGGQIRFDVNFDVNQSSLNTIKTSLKEIQNMTLKDVLKIDGSATEAELAKIKQSASELQGALQKSFNTDLGTLNISKFNSELHKLDLSTIQKNLAGAGTIGQKAFKDIATQALTTNMQLKQTNNFLDQMSKTMVNTVKWGVASSIMNTLTGSIQEAFGYVKALDSSLTDIRIVTGQSREEMSQFATQANEAAAALGRQTKEYTQAALTFYQQGLNPAAVQERTETVLKASNITGESTAQMADYLTAVWNGFQTAIGEENEVVSKLAAVADTSASNMSELATGMSKVASTANAMGVNIDQLSAQMATVIATTRQAPESVGVAFKTIYSRIADIKAGVEESGVTLGNYSGKMAQLGFSVLDSTGNLRDLGEVIEEIGGSWGNLTREQQIYLAQTMAGQRQYNNLIALFDNWDQYVKELNVSLNAQGTLDQKNAVYMESLAAHLKQLKAAQEGLISSFVDGNSFKGIIDGLTIVLNLFSKIIESIGGGGTALVALGGIAVRTFGQRLVQPISTFIINLQNAKSNAESLAAQIEVLKAFKGLDVGGEQFQKLVDMKQQVIDLGDALSLSEQNQANDLIKMTNEIQNQKNAWKNLKENAEEYLNRLATANQREINEGVDITNINDIFKGNLSNVDSKNLESLNSSLQIESRYLRDLRQDFDLYNTSLEESIQSMRNGESGTEALTASMQELYNITITKANADRLGKEKIEELNKAFNNFNNTVNNTNSTQNAQIQAARAFRNALSEAFQKLGEDAQAARQAVQQALNNIENDLETKSGNVETVFSNLINVGELKQQVSQVVNITSTLGQLSSVMMSIKNIGSIFSNENLSDGDKFLQIITNLSFSLPGLFSSLSKLREELNISSSILDVINTKWIANKAIQEANTLATIASQKAEEASIANKKALEIQARATAAAIHAQTLAEIEQAKATAINTAATEGGVTADEMYVVAEELQTEANIANAKAEAAEAAAIAADTAAKTANTTATEAATVAQNAFNASLLANPLFWVAAAGLAIWGVVAAYDAFTMSVKEADEAIEKFNSTYEQVQQNSIQNSKNLANLEGISDEYDELTKKAGLYDATIEQLTDEEKARYNEIKNTIAQYNQDAVVAYDEQGNAILKNNDALRETIELLKEKHQEELDQTYGGTEFQQAQKGHGVILQDAQQYLNTLQSTGPGQQQDLNENINYAINNIESNIDTLTGGYNQLSEKEQKALDTIRQIQKEGVEGFKARENEFRNNLDILLKNENLEPQVDNIKTSIDNLFNNISSYSAEIERAKKVVEQEDKFSINEVLGYLQTSEHQELYTQLQEAGARNADALIRQYVEGQKRSQYGTEGEEQFQGLIEDVEQQEQNLINVLSNRKSTKELNQVFDNLNTKTYNTVQERTLDIKQGIENAIQQNHNLINFPELIAQMVGVDQVTLNDDGTLKNYTDKVTKNMTGAIDEINVLLTTVGQQKINNNFDFQGLISEEDLSHFDQLASLIDLNTLKTKDLDEALSEARNQLTGFDQLSNLSAVLPTISEHGKIDKDQQEQLDAIHAKYQELNELRDQGGREYIQRLREIQEQEEDNYTKAAIREQSRLENNKTFWENYIQKQKEALNQSHNTEERLDLQASINVAEGELDKIQTKLDNTDFSANIKIAIDQDLASDVSQAFGIADEIGYLEAQISHGLEITFDQAQALIANGFGAMLQQAEETANQTIMLNKDVVNQFIDGKQSELDADRDAKIAQLENAKLAAQAELDALNAKKDALNESITLAEQEKTEEAAAALAKATVLQGEADAYAACKTAELTADQQKAEKTETIESGLANYIADVNEQNVKNAATAASDIASNTANMANNLVDSWNVAAQAAANYFNTVKSESTSANKVGASASGAITTKKSSMDRSAKMQIDLEDVQLDIDAVKKGILDAVKDSDDAAQEILDVAKQELAKTEKSITDVENQIGAMDAGIAALKSATNSLDKTQSGLGKGKGGGSKGGGGKSAKEKTPKEEKEKEPDHMDPFDEDDLDSIEMKFHDIDQEIQALTHDLDKLAKLQDRYLGSALVHNLNQQLSILKKQKAAYKEKLSIAKEELEKQKAKLQAQGVEIGKNGNIANYTDALKNKQEQINGLVDQYNNATAEGQENLKGQVDAQKKNYSELKNQMNAYEQLNGQTLPEIEAQIAEIEQMMIELQIEKFNAIIELHIDWQDFKNSYDDFKKELLEFTNTRATMFVDLATGEISGRDDPWQQAMDLAVTKRIAEQNAERQKQDAQQQYQNLQKAAKSKKGRARIADQLEALGIDSGLSKKELQQALADNYEETLEAINDTRDAIKEKAEEIYRNTLNPSSAAQVELQKALKASFDQANNIAKTEREQALEDYNTNQRLYKNRKKNQEELEAYYGVDLNDKQVKKNFKQTMLDTYNESIDDIERARQEAIDQAIKDYDAAIDAITDKTTESQFKIIDIFKTYSDTVSNVAEEIDQMINGTWLKDGARATSIVDDLSKHAGLIAERIQRMNENTKIDKQGYKIMGTDQLQVGNVDPLTGDRITNKKQLKQVKKAIGKDRSGQVYADMQKKIYEDGKNYATELQNNIDKLREKAEAAFEAFYAAIDKVIEYTNSIIDDYEYINDLYEIQIKMAELLSDTESDAADRVREKQKTNRELQLQYYREQIILMKNQLQQSIAQEGMLSESYNKYYDEYKTLIKGFYELQLDYIEDLQDAADDALDDIIEKLNKIETFDLGIDELSDRWSDMKDQADSYLDSVERAFAIQSVRTKYLQAIDDTDDLKQQTALRNIMEEQLKLLQEAEYLSEAEVTHAEDLLEVAKKQMALDEAKQNKNKMRLRRDSQGNYSYQFVADQNDVKNKAQELQDALKKMNEDTTNALEENYNNQVELFKNFIDQLKSIKEDYINDDLTDAEYEERLRYAQEAFQNQYSIYQAQQGRLTTNNQNANALSVIGMAGTATNLDQFMADMGISAEESETIRETLESLASEDGEFSLLKLLGSANIADVIDNMVEGASTILSSIDGVYELFEALPGDLLNDAAITHEKIDETIQQLLEEGKNRKEEIEEAKEVLATTTVDSIDDAVDVVTDNIQAVKIVQEDGVDLLDDIYQQCVDIYTDAMAAMAQMNDTLSQLLEVLAQMAEESGYGSGTGSVGKNKRATFGYQDSEGKLVRDTLSEDDMASINKKNFNKYVGDVNSKSGSIVIMSNKADKNGNVKIGYYEETTGKTYALGKVALNKLVGYDTGGYTGDWSGSNGKLAMLHKKEMVLNEDDTSKMLNAVEIARSIAEVVGSIGSNAAAQIRNVAGSIFGGKTDATQVEQDVTIHATFPNVTDHSEIEEALMNLVNVASQKASPNKRAI